MSSSNFQSFEIRLHISPSANIPRGNIEDFLEDNFANELNIVGAGSGKTGSNIEVEFFSSISLNKALSIIKRAASECGVKPADGYIVLEDRTRIDLGDID